MPAFFIHWCTGTSHMLAPLPNSHQTNCLSVQDGRSEKLPWLFHRSVNKRVSSCMAHLEHNSPTYKLLSLPSINQALPKCNKNFLNILTIHLNGMKTVYF